MYIYHALSAHMIRINLGMIFYTLVEHSPTKTIYIKYYNGKTNTAGPRTTHTHAHTHTQTNTRCIVCHIQVRALFSTFKGDVNPSCPPVVKEEEEEQQEEEEKEKKKNKTQP